MDNHIVISLGVGDIEHAKQFYCDGLGFELERAEGPFAAFKQSNGGPGLAMYSGDPLNYDAHLVEGRGGYRGVSLAYVVDTPERVDELMARAERAGATILEPAHSADWGGYSATSPIRTATSGRSSSARPADRLTQRAMRQAGRASPRDPRPESTGPAQDTARQRRH